MKNLLVILIALISYGNMSRAEATKNFVIENADSIQAVLNVKDDNAQLSKFLGAIKQQGKSKAQTFSSADKIVFIACDYNQFTNSPTLQGCHADIQKKKSNSTIVYRDQDQNGTTHGGETRMYARLNQLDSSNLYQLMKQNNFTSTDRILQINCEAAFGPSQSQCTISISSKRK